MSTDTSSFRELISNDPTLLASWGDLTSRLVTQAASQRVTIEPGQLAAISGVRLACLTGDESFLDGWQEAAKIQLPQWKAKVEKDELVAAIQKEDAQALEEIDQMNPNDRMAFARANSLGSPKVEPQTKEQSASDKSALLKRAEMLRGDKKSRSLAQMAFCNV